MPPKEIRPGENLPKSKESSTERLRGLERAREHIFRSKEFSDDEQRLEQMQEIDYRRAALIADGDEYTAHKETTPQTAFQEFFTNQAEQSLLALFEKGNLHYHLPPGIEYIETETDNGNTVAFRMEFVGQEVIKDRGICRFQLRVFEPYDADQGGHNIEHAAVVDVDLLTKTVRTVVVPVGIAHERPRMLLPASPDTGLLSGKVAIGLRTLVSIPDQIPKAAGDGITEAHGAVDARKNTLAPVDLLDQMESTIMWRRRTLTPETESTLPAQVESLLNSWSDEERAVLREAGEGSIKLRIISSSGANETAQFYEAEEHPDAADMEAIERTVHAEFGRGAEDVTISCVGSWVPRMQRNLPPGPSKRPHLKRRREGIRLYLNPRASTPELLELRRKFNAGDTLNDNEQERLCRLIGMKRVDLSMVLEEKSITFKDGSEYIQQDDAGSRMPIPSTYRRQL